MSEKPISPRRAQDKFGMFTQHGEMPNGELRFRLLNTNTGGYIRTVATEGSGWQKAHFHEKSVEIYAVEKGWMALCELVDGRSIIKITKPGQVIKTKKRIPHNVYLSDGAIIHTIKSGASTEKDWSEHKALTAETKKLSEEQIFAMAEQDRSENLSTVDANTKLTVLMNHYISLDRLIWGIPALFSAGAAITIGFTSSIYGKHPTEQLPVGLLAFAFFFSALLFFISFYSIHRMSWHHKLAGIEIGELSGLNYFSVRNRNLGKSGSASAHTVLKSIFAMLSAFFLVLCLVEIFAPLKVNSLLFGQSNPAPINAAQVLKEKDQTRPKGKKEEQTTQNPEVE